MLWYYCAHGRTILTLWLKNVIIDIVWGRGNGHDGFARGGQMSTGASDTVYKMKIILVYPKTHFYIFS